MTKLCAVVLAAGAGTRMKSRTSKVLHPLAGRPLLHYPLGAAVRAGADVCVVVASPQYRETIEESVQRWVANDASGRDIQLRVAVQERPLGSGDAARAALNSLPETGTALILSGDVPLVTEVELQRLHEGFAEAEVPLALLSCSLPDPKGYGRVVRDEQGRVQRIVEEKDLQDEGQRRISEINAGLYCADVGFLRRELLKLNNDNAQGEYYFTDLVQAAARAGGVITVSAGLDALQGINDRTQLEALERLLYERIATQHRARGVTVQGDARIDDTVTLEPDATVSAGVCLRGATRVGSGAHIDVGCVVTNSVIANDARLLPYTVVSESEVGPRACLGPFTHVRPHTRLDQGVKLGNFVEVKASHLEAGAKANHLAYIGDGEVGEETNIGAGTIFCNYDGHSKAKTKLGKHVFVGSDSQFVAPVEVGDGAYVATGTTVTQDVPPRALAIGRTRQTNKPDYATKLAQKLKAKSAES